IVVSFSSVRRYPNFEYLGLGRRRRANPPPAPCQPHSSSKHLNNSLGRPEEWSRHLPRSLLGFTICLFVMASGCSTLGAHPMLQQNPMAPGVSPKLLAVYMPWFGDHTHMDV